MSELKKIWARKWVRRSIYFLSFSLLLFLFRNPIFRGIGKWLAATDTPELTQACFVLGGNSFERGAEAANLYKQFPEQQYVCTGGNYPLQIRVLIDTLMSEAELSRYIMIKKGVPEDHLAILENSRSTMDEANEILAYCKEKSWNDITVLSSTLHMRRVKWVFDDKFEDEGIKVHYHGANAEEYNSENWWQNEEGLIMANNEIVKLFYYFFKY